MATLSGIPAWKIPQTEEPGRLHSPWGYKESATTERLSTRHSIGFPGGSDGKAFAYNAGDLGSIPGLGRFPGEGNGSPLQYPCLEKPMDGGAW